ncbi:23S rRNA pseudouridine(955/2504/2580) synthase RluC [Teredinibacter turnerae]|uniref:23S rRNA pseudouridine(955/2504/2580) synthase RluC n=1 Tax=Teredinibacter turnerae TaxID=2426 RepID=UPI000415A3AB|nr:23S rRNA pseudouridine(955/2504/2580) synthase RluC [Teredinibacter turnerae]
MSQQVQFFTITDDNAGQRIDNFLVARLKGAPKSLIYRIIRRGEVRVNKGRVKPERKLAVGDLVRVPPIRLAEPDAPTPAGKSLLLALEDAILYETDQLLVVNKPSGLAVHGGSGVNLGLIEAMRQLKAKDTALELVHRLDRETSGCILIARKRSMLRYLQDLFRGEKQVDKRYQALVKGRWPNRAHSVNVPLLKGEVGNGERIVRASPEGKPSRTEFDVLERFESATLIEARPITGRTHQIRVHAQYKGHPLVGDDKYGDDEFNKVMSQFGSRRLFLHAGYLGVPMPDGEYLEFRAPLPDDLQATLKQLKASER